MAWTTPKTNWATNDVPSASQMNDIGNNLSYLLSRVGSSGRRDNGSNYTIAANTFAAVDSTNLAKTLTLAGTRVLVTVNCTLVNSGANVKNDLDVNVNGTRWGRSGIDGLTTVVVNSATSPGNGSFSVFIDGLTPGSNVFQLMWKAQATTSTMYSGAGSAGTDYIPSFSVQEC